MMPRFMTLTMLCLVPLAATFRVRLKKARRCDGSNATQDCEPKSLRQEPPGEAPSTTPPPEPLPFECKMKNVTDKDKCGVTLNPNTSEKCYLRPCTEDSSTFWCPNCWLANTCEVQDQCPFRLTLYITGALEIFSVKHVSATIAYDRNVITGHPLVTDWFDKFPLTRNFLISTAMSIGNNLIQDELPNIRPKLIELIGTMLRNPEVFAKLDLTTRLAIGPNISKFMELVPDITLRALIEPETGAINATLSIPDMTDHTTLSACGTIGGGGGAYWARVAIMSAVAALLAWRYPRVGLAIAIGGFLLSRQELVEPACQTVLPMVTRDSGIIIPKSLAFDEETQENIGLPPQIGYNLDFVGDNLHILINELDVPLLNKIINNVAAKYGKDILKPDDGSESKLDLSIGGAYLNIDDDGHIIQLRSGTYVQVDSYLDADCLQRWIGTTTCLLWNIVR